MRDKITEVLRDLRDSNLDWDEAIDKLCDLHSVSKRFEIDFIGDLFADIEISNNTPKVNRAVNGYGDTLVVEYIDCKEVS